MDPCLDHDPLRWRMPSGPPGHPGFPGTPGFPGLPGAGEGLAPWLEERLFDQRIVMIRGPLTGPAASQTAAALFTLDSLGAADPVRLHIDSPDGELAAAFAVIDAIDAMRAPVHAVVTAQAGGAVIGVLAAADRRLAYRHARIRLAEPRAAAVAGTADEVAAAAGQYLRELEELALRIVTATGQSRSRVEEDLSAGRVLTSAQARDYGLIDEIVGSPPD